MEKKAEPLALPSSFTPLSAGLGMTRLVRDPPQPHQWENSPIARGPRTLPSLPFPSLKRMTLPPIPVTHPQPRYR